MTVWLKRTILLYHRWVGIVLGLWLVFQGLSGAAIAFRPELTRAFHAGATVEVTGPFRPLGELETVFRSNFPQYAKDYVQLLYPETDTDALTFRILRRGEQYAFVHVDQYAGTVSGHRTIWQSPLDLLFTLHEQLRWGTLGFTVNGAFAVSLLLMAITGVYLWWPRVGGWKQVLRVRRRFGLRVMLYDLHRAVGTYAFVMFFVIAASASLTVFLPGIVQQLNLPFESLTAVRLKEKPSGEKLPLHELVAIAEARFPGSRPNYVYPSFGDPNVTVVTFHEPATEDPRDQSRVWINSFTGEAMLVRAALDAPPLRKFHVSMLSIHNGVAMGMPGRVLVLIAGLCMPVLFVTGVWHYVKRRNAAKPRPA
jgi:uncharacterized iron-regulated membrane protein